MLRFARVIPAAIVLAVALTGCAAPATELPGVPAASVPAATATSVVLRPVQAFDGLCSNLFTVDELAEAIGSDVGGEGIRVVESEGLTVVREPRGAATVQAGGVECSWGYATNGESAPPALRASVTPTAGNADYDVPEDCNTNSFSGADCELSALASGHLMSFELNRGVAGAPLAELEAAADRVSALFAEKAVHAAPDSVLPEAPGVWEATDCETLASNPAVIAALGDSTLVGGPSDDSMGAPGTESTGYAACTWSNIDSKFLAVQILPGGAWAEAEIAGNPDAVRSADPALGDIVTVGGTVHVFDGSNWLSVIAYSPTMTKATAYAAAAAIVGALNAS